MRQKNGQNENAREAFWRGDEAESYAKTVRSLDDANVEVKKLNAIIDSRIPDDDKKLFSWYNDRLLALKAKQYLLIEEKFEILKGKTDYDRLLTDQKLEKLIEQAEADLKKFKAKQR